MGHACTAQNHMFLESYHIWLIPGKGSSSLIPEKQKLLNYENNKQGTMRSDSVTRAWYHLRCHFPIPYLPVLSESKSLNALM